MASLYQLTNNYLNLLDLLTNPEVPEEIINDSLNQLGGDITDKIENIVKVIKSLEGDIETHKKEELRLSTNRKHLENKVANLKSYIESTMSVLMLDKIKCDLFTISKANNPKSVKITNEKLLPKEYFKITESVDKAKLKEDLKNGVVIEGAELEQKQSLRIK